MNFTKENNRNYNGNESKYENKMRIDEFGFVHGIRLVVEKKVKEKRK